MTVERWARRQSTIGIACAVSSGLLFSVSTVCAAKALQLGSSVVAVSAGRVFVACALVWLLGTLVGRDPTTATQRLRLMAVGTLTSVQVLLLYQAVEQVSASLAVLLLYSYPMLVAVMSALFLHERMTAMKIAAVAITVAGAALVVGRPNGTVTVMGVLCGLGAGLALATYIVLAARVTQGFTPLTSASWMQLGSVVVMVPVVAVRASGSWVTPGWPWAVGVGLASGAASAFFLGGIRRLTPTVASTASTIEPITTALLAALLVGDSFSPPQMVGGALIVVSLVLVARTPAAAALRQPSDDGGVAKPEQPPP